MNLTHIAAFLSGAGAILSAFVSLRLTQKRMRKECIEHVEEMKKTLMDGYRLGRE